MKCQMPLTKAFLVIKQVLQKLLKVNSSGLNCELAISISTILLFTQKLFLMSKTEFAKVFSTKQLSQDVPDL